MESFFDEFPEEETQVLVWLLLPDPALADAVRQLQRALAHLDWVVPLPPDFFHTAIAVDEGDPEAVIERGRAAWSGVRPFEVAYSRVNCFHTAVVVEVAGDGPPLLVDRLRGPDETFLPHLTIATFAAEGSAAQVRDAVAPLRNAEIGRQLVDRVTLCRVPASRSTVLQPWTVVGEVALG